MQPLIAAQPLSLLGLTSRALKLEAEARVGPGAGIWRAVYHDAHQLGRFEPERHGVSASSARLWRSAFGLPLPVVLRTSGEPSRHPTDPRATVKLALQMGDGLEVETVRIPMSKGRWTLCLSTQVGCRLACRFCETGRLGLLRNLEPAEIVAQVVVARSIMGWPIRNLVFMGMGEPLDNADNLIEALRILTDPRGLGFGQARITVCTSGVPSGLQTLAELGYRRMGLSFSLNAAEDGKRSRLMPVNRRYPLEDIQRALIAYPKREGFVLALNYCLLPGFNDDPEDALAVARFAEPLGRTVINVIPYNPGTKPISRSPTEDEIHRFIRFLKNQDLVVCRRRTKGGSVMAACGQLGNLGLKGRGPARSRPRTSPDQVGPAPR